MKGVIPSPEFMEQIKRTVREVLRRERGDEPTSHNRKKSVFPIVVLTADLAAADDRFNDSTIPSATACFVERATSTTWAKDTGNTITLYNRAENIEYENDTLGTYALVLGKPCFMPLDCGPPTT